MGYRINVKNCKYAKVNTDTASAYAIGDVVDLPALRSIDMTLLSASGELYGDGALVSKMSKLTGATVKIGIDKLPQAARADMLGSTISANGILDTAVTDQPGKIALYCETELDDGGKEAIWLLVGKADPISLSAQQSEANINYSTDEITINFVRREKDKLLFRFGDTDNALFTSAVATSFATNPDA